MQNIMLKYPSKYQSSESIYQEKNFYPMPIEDQKYGEGLIWIMEAPL